MKEAKTREEFRDLIPQLKRWGEYVDIYLTSVLNESGLGERIVKWPKFRLKDEDEFIRKVFWRNLNIPSPLKMNDKVGTRIVVVSYAEAEVIVKSIQENTDHFRFATIKTPDFKNKSDYQAYHIILYPKGNTPGFEGLGKEGYSKLSCEVQVKTAVQDTLATIAHATIYKGYYSNNDKIKNKFSDIANEFKQLEMRLSDLENEMNSDSAHITAFVDGLRSLGSEFLDGEYAFSEVDNKLSESIFHKYHPTVDLKIEDLRKILSKNKELVINLF